MLNQDMQALHQYLEHWRLKLSMVKTTTTTFHLHNKDIQRHLHISVNSAAIPNNDHPVYLGVMLDHTLTYRQHIESLKRKVNGRNELLCCLAGSSWRACTAIACWYTVLPSTHHPYGAAVLTSPSLIRASTTLCLLLPGVCVQRRIPFYPTSPASHHPTSIPSHMSPTLTKKPWRTQITYITKRDSSATTVSRQLIRSCRPFTRHAACFLSTEFDTHNAWNNHVNHESSYIQTTCPPPSSSLSPGADLPRKLCVRLNHLRSGTARVGKTLHH